MAEPVHDDLRAAVVDDGDRGREGAGLGVGVAALDVEDAGGRGGDDRARGCGEPSPQSMLAVKSAVGGQRVGVGEGADDRGRRQRDAGVRRECNRWARRSAGRRR